MPPLPRTDFHIHATGYTGGDGASDMTVGRIVPRYAELGFEAIGILEHLSDSAPGSVEAMRRIVADVRAAPRDGLRIAVGAEFNIHDDRGAVSGSAALKEELGLDYCLAAVHGFSRRYPTLDDFLRTYHGKIMGVVEHCDFVDVIAHPWNEPHKMVTRGALEAWRFSFVPDRLLDEFIEALAAHGTAMEVSTRFAADFAEPAFRDYLLRARRAGVKVAVGSDAHALPDTGSSTLVDAFLADLGFQADDLWRPSAGATR